MKKVKILLIFMVSMLLFINKVYALDDYNIKCPNNIIVGEPFTCEIIIKEPVIIDTELKIYEGSREVTTNGKIKFKAENKKKYDISLISLDYNTTYKTITISANELDTTKKTTTTTIKKSSNNYLSAIIIDDEEIKEFDKEETKYFINVDEDKNNISIKPVVYDDKAKYEITGPDKLDIGDNEYTITVTAEDGSIKYYKLLVTKKKEEITSSKIKNIKIKGYNLNFDGTSLTYHLKVNENVNKLDIKVTLEDNNSKYEITGNENLKDGSIINIKVSNDDENSLYRIIISKPIKKNYIPYIIISLLLMVIATIIVIVIIKKKNNKNSKPDKKNSEPHKKTIENSAKYDTKTNLEKTIDVSNISSNVNHIDNDDKEETKSFDYNNILDDEKTIDLSDEINKCFSEKFDDN